MTNGYFLQSKLLSLLAYMLLTHMLFSSIQFLLPAFQFCQCCSQISGPVHVKLTTASWLPSIAHAHSIFLDVAWVPYLTVKMTSPYWGKSRRHDTDIIMLGMGVSINSPLKTHQKSNHFSRTWSRRFTHGSTFSWSLVRKYYIFPG